MLVHTRRQVASVAPSTRIEYTILHNFFVDCEVVQLGVVARSKGELDAMLAAYLERPYLALEGLSYRRKAVASVVFHRPCRSSLGPRAAGGPLRR